MEPILPPLDRFEHVLATLEELVYFHRAAAHIAALRQRAIGRQHLIDLAIKAHQPLAARNGLQHLLQRGQGDWRRPPLAHLPVAVAVLSPFSDVLFDERTALELFGQNGLDLGQGIEPLEERGAGFVVLQTPVDLLAQFARQASNFSSFHALSG